MNINSGFLKNAKWGSFIVKNTTYEWYLCLTGGAPKLTQAKSAKLEL